MPREGSQASSKASNWLRSTWWRWRLTILRRRRPTPGRLHPGASLLPTIGLRQRRSSLVWCSNSTVRMAKVGSCWMLLVDSFACCGNFRVDVGLVAGDLFAPESVDGMQLGSPAGRVDAEGHTDGNGDGDRSDDGRPRDGNGIADEVGEDDRPGQAEDGPE